MTDPTAYSTPVDVPVCPRHPDRESHVRCQRCARPVCPECQRPAAVGVQCVDCVHQTARESRTATTIFGGAVNPRGAIVTYTIMAICVVVYIAELVSPAVFQRFAFSPATGASEPWRALTAAFLHSPQMFLHIVFNLLVLWQIGPYLEGLLGRLRYLVLFLVCAVGGSAGFLLLASPPTAADLFGALLVLNRHLGRSTAGIGVIILINAAIGFFYPGIAWQAHLGGFITGLACAGVITLLNKRNLRRYAVLGMLGVLVVVVTLMAAKYSTVPPMFR